MVTAVAATDAFEHQLAAPTTVVVVGESGLEQQPLLYELEQAGFEIVHAEPEPWSLLAAVVGSQANVVVLHAATADRNVLDLVKAVQSDPRAPAVVGVVPPDATLTAALLLASGVTGCVSSTAIHLELVEALSWAADGGAWVSPRLLAKLLQGNFVPERGVEDERMATLTQREREVLALMTEGISKSVIASRLDLSVNTVRTHVQSIMRKLRVHSSTGAVSYGLIAASTPAGIADRDRRWSAAEWLFGTLPLDAGADSVRRDEAS